MSHNIPIVYSSFQNMSYSLAKIQIPLLCFTTLLVQGKVGRRCIHFPIYSCIVIYCGEWEGKGDCVSFCRLIVRQVRRV